MRPLLAALLLLLTASTVPLAARADTVDVMTVSGNGHIWTFDFSSIQNFNYPGVPLFVPGFTPLSETIDGASVTPGEIYIHPYQNVSGPFGQIITNGNPLDILSINGYYTDPNTWETYVNYTATFYTGNFYGSEFIYNGNGGATVPFSIYIQQQSTAPTPEPPGLLLLATAGIAITAFRRRLAHL